MSSYLRRTDFGEQSTNHHLLAASRLESIAKLFVVKGIYLTNSTDPRRIGVHLPDFSDQGAVGASVVSSGDDNGQVEQAGEGSVTKQTRFQLLWQDVTSKIEKAFLIVDSDYDLESRATQPDSQMSQILMQLTASSMLSLVYGTGGGRLLWLDILL